MSERLSAEHWGGGPFGVGEFVAEEIPLKVSIGLLAHQEEGRIEAMLDSLFAQDIFDRVDTEVIIVANGCTDATAEVARGALERHRSRWSHRGSARVENLPIAGKANAWNEFVHRLSKRGAAMLVLMDADIWFLGPDTLSQMVRTLQEAPRAVVCVDRPIKDIQIRKNRTLVQRLLATATPEIDPDDIRLCGQLYCSWANSLRSIYLPPEIQGEDGFIRALLLTRGFTAPEDRSRIVLAPGAAHAFAAVANIQELLRHEQWLVASSIVNMLLFRRLGKEARPGRDAVALMREWRERDPDWLPRYVQAQVRERGWRLLPREWWIRRWIRLRRLPLSQWPFRLPIATLAAALDAFIFLRAIRQVQLGHAYRYWRSG